MLRAIKENLSRQAKGTGLLHSLLEEEFSLLRDSKSHLVSEIELSIQELMRQLMSERMGLKKMIGRMDPAATRLAHLHPLVPGPERDELQKLLRSVDAMEQRCAIQAEQNRQLVLALYDQSKSMLGFLHQQIMPKNQNTYSARGRMYAPPPMPTLVRGRF